MSIGLLLLIILILALIGVLPAWPHSRSWGYGPTGGEFRAAPGSLESFLTDRYCLYAADRRGRICRAV